MEKIEKLVPDTSVIVEGLVSLKIGKEFEVQELIIHEAVLAELEHQANEGKSIGLLGLDEIERLKELSEGNFNITFKGRRPSSKEIEYASLGEIDHLIRDMAWEESATLMTADKVQARIAKAKGIPLILIKRKEKSKEMKLDSFFDDTTMSVHLREGVVPYVKKGKPGEWTFEAFRKELLTQDEIKDISREIIEEARARKDGFIEIEREGSTIVQLGTYRIVITRPAFSDGWEITAVRPVKRLDINDYKLSEKLLNRFEEHAEGILISGAPGMGKSTFASALAKFYADKGKIVKTVEAPRDLVLPENITQYAISHGSSQEIHDILLLSRPDYTLFDEMRNREDFDLFADLRLSGIGLAGVIHATNPIDSIQRFVGKIELGVIPHIVDTVVFIKDGQIGKVLSLQMEVKVPSGMTEADLARPVVTVNDFESGKLEYELYSYGEETVVVPVKEQKGGPSKGVFNMLKEPLEDYFLQFTDNVEVEILSENKAVVRVPEYSIGGLIGKGGENISKIEEELGIGIDVEELAGVPKRNKPNYKGKGNKKKGKRRH